MVHDMLFFILFYFISFCGNDIISDINLKYDNRYLFSIIRLILSPTLYKFIVWAYWAKIQSYFGSKPKLVLTIYKVTYAITQWMNATWFNFIQNFHNLVHKFLTCYLVIRLLCGWMAWKNCYRRYFLHLYGFFSLKIAITQPQKSYQ